MMKHKGWHCWQRTTALAMALLALLPGLPALAQTRPPAAPVPVVDAARTDGAIASGLGWLAEHQVRKGTDAGSWAVGTQNYRPAIAALAGLAFLANGHLPGDAGPYGKTVADALTYVRGTAATDGYVGQGDLSGMYIHAITTLFALSCLGMQADEALDPELAEWCRRSLDVIVRAQKIAKGKWPRGGWRYDPYTSESDVSVTCWMLLVLHTARQAGFEVDQSVFDNAQSYLNRAYVKVTEPAPAVPGPAKVAPGPAKAAPGPAPAAPGPAPAAPGPAPAAPGPAPDEPAGGYLYRPGNTHTAVPSDTALVLFIQSLLGTASEKRTREALTYLRRYSPAWGGKQYDGFFYFASFYMVQGMFQVGGDDWKAYGPRLATVLLDHQASDGSWPYPSDNNYPGEVMECTGPAYPAAMAVLILSLDKQYLPMYQRQRRFYETGSVVAAVPEEKLTDDAATTKPPDDKDGLVTPPPPPPPPPTAGREGPEAAKDGAWEEPGEEKIDRTIGRPMFKP